MTGDSPLPAGFVLVRAVAPDVQVELKYATPHNFTGRPVDGYRSAEAAVLRVEAATALAAVQRQAVAAGFGVLVYDAYRPTRAVRAFVDWSEQPDAGTKDEFHPSLDKHELFSLGYIAQRSLHSTGAAVDVTLTDRGSGAPVDMGGGYDLLDPRSRVRADGLTRAQQLHRLALRDLLTAGGFEPFDEEWWHFALPGLDPTPHDFPVG